VVPEEPEIVIGDAEMAMGVKSAAARARDAGPITNHPSPIMQLKGDNIEAAHICR
jgi:hypothetical protein